MQNNLEKLKCLTEDLLKKEQTKKSESHTLQKLLDFSTDGFFIYDIVFGFFYISDKARVKLDLEIFDEKINTFFNTLKPKSVDLIKNEIHEILILNKDYFRVTIETKNNKIILINLLVLKRNTINKPTQLGGSIIVLEES